MDNAYKTVPLKLTVNTNALNLKTSVKFYTQDIQSAKLIFTVLKDGKVFDLTNATSAVLTFIMADNSTFQETAAINDPVNGVVSYVLSSDMLSHPGLAQAELDLYFGDTQGLSVGQFQFNIVQSLTDQDNKPVTQYYIESIETLRTEAQKALDDAKASIVNVDSQLVDVNSQLAENMNKNPIYLVDRGVSHLKTAAENTPLIQQAISDAEASGRPIFFPWVPNGSWIDIDAPLTIETGSISIYGVANKSRIRQTVFPNPVFDVLAPNVDIRNFFFSGVDFDPTGYYDTMRGNETRVSYYSGIWVSADNVHTENIEVENLVCGVHIVAWDGILNVAREQLEDVSVDRLKVNNVVFGMIAAGVKNFSFKNIKGSYNLMNVGMPPHLVYFSQTSGDNLNIIGGDCIAYDGMDSYAYMFKGINGGEVNNLLSDNCKGSMMFLGSSNLRVDGLYAVNDTSTDSDDRPAIDLNTQTNNISISNINLKLSGSGKALRMVGDNCKATNVDIETNHTTTSTSASDVELYGTNNLVDNIKVKNSGTVWNACIGINNGDRNIVSRPKTGGNSWGVAVAKGVNHKIKNYDISDLEYVFGTEGNCGSIFTAGQAQLHSANNLKASGIGQQDRLIAFDRTDTVSGLIRYTTSGHQWTLSNGTLYIKDGRIHSKFPSPALAFLSLNTPNIDLSAGIKYANREYLAIRIIDKDNMIFIRLNHGVNEIQIYKLDNAVETKLQGTAFTPFGVQIGRRYHLRAVVFGNALEVYVDGIKWLAYTLDADTMTKYGTITNHGIGGIGDTNGYFDNIEWRSLE